MRLLIIIIHKFTLILLSSSGGVKTAESHVENLCSFEEGACGWKIEQPWNVVSMLLVPTIVGGHTARYTSDGPFLIAQGKYGSVTNSIASTQELSESATLRLLSFKILKTGSSRLRIVLITNTTQLLLDSIGSDEIINEWKTRSVVIPRILNSSYISFECSNVRNGEDVIALDDIQLTTMTDEVPLSAGVINSREIRRHPVRHQPHCRAIRCSFVGSSCNWKTTNTQSLDGKIVNEGAGESIIISPLVKFPADAHLFFELFDSKEALVDVTSMPMGIRAETVLWKKSITENQGWTKVLIPIVSHVPTQIKIRFVTKNDEFVALKTIDLVDSTNDPLDCENVSPPIQPRTDPLVRLTAVQNLQLTPLDTIQYQSPVAQSPMALPTTMFSEDEETPRPITPHQVFAFGIPIKPFPPVKLPST